MNVIITPTGEKKVCGIYFPPLQCWNPETKVITIAAQVSGKRVSCRVSFRDIKKKFHVFNDDAMAVAKQHRTELENAARKLINSNSYEEDGSIRIRYANL